MAGPGQFAGRVALVTGGTRGIGAAITRALAREGARVYAVFRANLAAATVLADEVGDDVITVCADVSEAEAANSLVERAVEESGRLDVLINCAGGAVDRLLLRATPDYVRQTLALNLESVIHCARAALTPMLRQRYGRIVTIPDKLVSGTFRVQPGDVVIGKDLADDLGVGIGDRIRVLARPDVSDTYVVQGTLDLGLRDLNRRSVYMGLRSAQSILDLTGGV